MYILTLKSIYPESEVCHKLLNNKIKSIKEVFKVFILC